METTPAMGVPSISVSQKQTPKKFGPVVAPKPQFNPYKTGDPIDHAEGKRWQGIQTLIAGTCFIQQVALKGCVRCRRN